MLRFSVFFCRLLTALFCFGVEVPELELAFDDVQSACVLLSHLLKPLLPP